MGQQSLQAIVLAAGKGTRMKSDLPKVLHQVCGRSLLARVLRSVAPLKPTRICVVIGHGETLVREELSRLAAAPEFNGIEITAVVQSEQRGTGHAVQVALSKLAPASSRILILPGDIPLVRSTTLQPLLVAAENDAADLAVLTFEPTDPTGFGRVVRSSSGSVERIVEHRDCSEQERAVREVNSSIYLATESFLRDGVSSLKPNNAQGELYLTDIVSYGVSQKRKVTAHCAECADDVAGANSRAELSELVQECRRRINEQIMLDGVTLEDPQTTYIDDTVQVGVECFIGAGTRLYGATVVGDRAVLEGQSRIVNSTIGSGAVVKFSCDIESGTLGSRVQVGPFARIRPGSVLHEDVRIGNFVETKNTTMHAGAKANHLSYLGDSSVGAGANVGAGTITCNYDGVNKFRTEIGEGAFIGSNTSLVAPIKVGKGAVIGAGSVITKEVPEGALALERNNQTVIKEWASKRRTTKPPKHG